MRYGFCALPATFFTTNEKSFGAARSLINRILAETVDFKMAKIPVNILLGWTFTRLCEFLLDHLVTLHHYISSGLHQ